MERLWEELSNDARWKSHAEVPKSVQRAGTNGRGVFSLLTLLNVKQGSLYQLQKIGIMQTGIIMQVMGEA